MGDSGLLGKFIKINKQLQDKVPAHKSTKLDFCSSIKYAKVNVSKVDPKKDNIVRCNG